MLKVPKYNNELILSDELDGSIISLFLRDDYASRCSEVDADASSNQDIEYQLRGIGSLRSTIQ